jgi:hypothetical protein
VKAALQALGKGLSTAGVRLMKSPPSTGQVALELTWGGNRRHCVKREHGSVSRDTFASLSDAGRGIIPTPFLD